MTLSLFTPTHNSKYLAELYDSIKDQPFDEWVILYNNGAEPVELTDPRIKHIEVDISMPWVGFLKKLACSYCTSDILLEMDHDDLLAPGAIAAVKAAFAADAEVGFVYSNTIHCTGDFKKIQRFDEKYGWQFRELTFNGHALDEHISFPPVPNAISRIWFAPNHLRAFTRQAYDAVGGYNQQMRILDDLDLMCRLYCTTKFYHLDKGLYVYRVHGENTWLVHNQEIQQNVHRIHDQYIESICLAWSKREKLQALDLGGRFSAATGYTTVDLKNADVVCDLNQTWPFPDNSVGVVRAHDVFEHLRDPLHTMKELYRVLAPDGYALIQVPSTEGRGAFQDPTHVSFWNQNSFLYYTDRQWAQYIDTPVRFQTIRLYTTERDAYGVCWTRAHLVKLAGQRVPGQVCI